jgi:hypothetical protein
MDWQPHKVRADGLLSGSGRAYNRSAMLEVTRRDWFALAGAATVANSADAAVEAPIGPELQGHAALRVTGATGGPENPIATF